MQRRFIGAFPSLKKQGTMVRYASALERDLLFFFEWDSDVLNYNIRPFTVTLTNDIGTVFDYTPTFSVQRTTRTSLVECRPTSLLTADVEAFWIARAEAWAHAHDYDFVVVIEHDLRASARLANLKLLWRYSRHHVPYAHVAACQALLQSHPEGLPLCSVAAHLTGQEGSLVHAPTLYALLFRHILCADLDQPLTPASRLWYNHT